MKSLSAYCAIGCRLFLAAALGLLYSTARAVPSFARQMNMQCILCHTSFPELTPFGRQFKLNGYSTSAETTSLPPIAIMLQPSFTHTAAAQPGGAAPGFGGNDNAAFSQVSLFYSGRLFGPYAKSLFGQEGAAVANKFGIFSQATYDGATKQWAWDNTELRFADTRTWANRNVTYGAYVNNNPTMQDPWNSTPAWSFPFSGSHLAPTPAAGVLIDGALAQQVVGAGAYAMIANTAYADFGVYRTLGARLQKKLGTDPTGEDEIAGAAPYLRLAWTKPVGAGTWEVGALALAADTYPGRERSAGRDRRLDFGVDSEYQISAGRNDFTLMLSSIGERQSRGASAALGATTNDTDRLWSGKLTFDYLYDKTYGLTFQVFGLDGSRDALAYPTSQNGSPSSNGYIVQLSFLPINKRTGPAFWPRSNVKLSVQYVGYNRFDGARRNIDGAGRSAANNDTLYLEAWIVF